jgi:hypothetical protein
MFSSKALVAHMLVLHQASSVAVPVACLCGLTARKTMDFLEIELEIVRIDKGVMPCS